MHFKFLNKVLFQNSYEKDSLNVLLFPFLYIPLCLDFFFFFLIKLSLGYLVFMLGIHWISCHIRYLLFPILFDSLDTSFHLDKEKVEKKKNLVTETSP